MTSGGESDVCVLATVLGGIDLGYRVVFLKDAIYNGRDETHDALTQVARWPLFNPCGALRYARIPFVGSALLLTE